MANVLAVGGPNSKYQVAGSGPAGFWAGFWHGLICPITFLFSLFDDGVRIYEANNKGRLYEFGFVLGASTTFGGSGSQTHVVRVNTSY